MLAASGRPAGTVDGGDDRMKKDPRQILIPAGAAVLLLLLGALAHAAWRQPLAFLQSGNLLVAALLFSALMLALRTLLNRHQAIARYLQQCEQALRQANANVELGIRARTAALEAANEQLRQQLEQHKGAEQARARSEDRQQEIIAMMPLPLFIKDAESRLLLMNQACEDMWGVPFSALSGTRGSAHFPPEQMDSFLAQDRAAFAEGALQVNEEQVWNPTLKENRTILTFKKPTFDHEGKPLLLIAMSIDITERKRAEQEMLSSLAQWRALAER